MTLEEAKKDMLKFVQLKTNMALRPAFLDPLLNAVEERHGHWEDEIGGLLCSECGDPWGKDDEEMVNSFNYCPNCGARMHKQVTGKLPASEEEE